MAGLDPMQYFDAYNTAYANYLAADGPDSATDALDILIEGLHQTFYSDCIREIRAERRERSTTHLLPRQEKTSKSTTQTLLSRK